MRRCLRSGSMLLLSRRQHHDALARFSLRPSSSFSCSNTHSSTHMFVTSRSYCSSSSSNNSSSTSTGSSGDNKKTPQAATASTAAASQQLPQQQQQQQQQQTQQYHGHHHWHHHHFDSASGRHEGEEEVNRTQQRHNSNSTRAQVTKQLHNIAAATTLGKNSSARANNINTGNSTTNRGKGIGGGGGGGGGKDSQQQAPSLPANVPAFIKQGQAEYGWKFVKQGVRRIPMRLNQTTISERVQTYVMPKGYPRTVSPGFARFFTLTMVNTALTSFSTSLATQALLKGFFTVSNPSTWMLKDMIPILISATLANSITTYETRTKYWFLCAAIITQCGILVEFLIPSVLPASYYLAGAAGTALVKGSAGLMFSITRATLVQNFATHQNFGEVTKKIVTFVMVTYTCSGALGIGFVKLFPSFHMHLFAVVLCSIGSILLTLSSVQPLAFRNLNSVNTLYLIDRFIDSGYSKVLTPDQISDIFGIRGLPPKTYINDVKKRIPFFINPSLNTVKMTDSSLDAALGVFGASHKVTIGVWGTKPARSHKLIASLTGKKRPSDKDIHRALVLFVHKECEIKQLLMAMLVCVTALRLGQDESKVREFLLNEGAKRTRHWQDIAGLLYLHLESSGWDVSATHTIDNLERRITFNPDARGEEEEDEDEDEDE